MSVSDSPTAPHEESPPPQYSEVVQCHEDHPPAAAGERDSYKTPVLLTGVCLTLLSVVILGFLVGDLLVRLDVLEVRLETRTERELDTVKRELAVLVTRLDYLKQTETDFSGRIELLSRRVDGLQEAFKTGDVKHLVSRAQNVRATQISTFLVIISVFFSISY